MRVCVCAGPPTSKACLGVRGQGSGLGSYVMPTRLSPVVPHIRSTPLPPSSVCRRPEAASSSRSHPAPSLLSRRQEHSVFDLRPELGSERSIHHPLLRLWSAAVVATGGVRGPPSPRDVPDGGPGPSGCCNRQRRFLTERQRASSALERRQKCQRRPEGNAATRPDSVSPRGPEEAESESSEKR